MFTYMKFTKSKDILCNPTKKTDEFFCFYRLTAGICYDIINRNAYKELIPPGCGAGPCNLSKEKLHAVQAAELEYL